MDGPDGMEKTPFNRKADYRETDHAFRERLESLVPADIAERIARVMKKRERGGGDSENNARAANE